MFSYVSFRLHGIITVYYYRGILMKNRVRYKSFDQLSFTDILVYSKLPKHAFWSNIEAKIDFSFADSLCSVLYSGRGQHPYAPSLKLKVHLVQAYYFLSDRLVEEKIIGDLFIKRFLGLPVEFFGFDHSTIGLDRNRMGTALFQACHLYILAQMYSLGLWGDHNEKWIIDSFPSNIGVAMVGSYRLIQQGMIRILQHLKRSHAALFKQASESLMLDTLTCRLSAQSSTSDQMLAFSKLVGQAYALLYWFETEEATLLFWTWDNKHAQQKSLKLQAILKQILTENSKPSNPDPDPQLEAITASDSSDEQTSESVPLNLANSEPVISVQYEKIPRKKRPAHRIISSHAPEARLGAKSRFVMIKGFKTQNLCSTSSVILDTRVIPASEADREVMVDMAQGIQSFFRITPQALLGDTAYGYGKERVQLAALGIDVIAPVATRNPSGLFPISRFTYDREKDVYRCPNEKETYRKNANSEIEGFQYHFKHTSCRDCPLKNECTTGKSRSIFHSNYFDIYEAAKAFNESDEGKEAHKLRYLVERKNNELKNDCGLGRPDTRNQKQLQMKSTLAAIVVNLKLTVRRLIAPKPGFVRRLQPA